MATIKIPCPHCKNGTIEMDPDKDWIPAIVSPTFIKRYRVVTKIHDEFHAYWDGKEWHPENNAIYTVVFWQNIRVPERE